MHQAIRKPSDQEIRLVEFLIDKASVDISFDWKDGLLVASMDDGGMGSICLFPKGAIKEGRKFGKRISEYQFTDEDGIEVIASLTTNQNGGLFELDIWKTDFSPLKKLPENIP